MPLTKLISGLTGGVQAPSQQFTPTPSVAAANQGYQLPQPEKQEELVTEQPWDYATATTGPSGQALPTGAIGWRPDGSPDFGTGFQAWQKESYWKISSGFQKGWEEGERIAEEAGYKGDTMQRFASAYGMGKAVAGVLGNALLAPLNIPGQLTEQLSGSVGFALQDLVYNGKGLDTIDWKGNWEAARLGYSAALNPFIGKGNGLRDEFISRMNAGERPDIIAEDMQIKGQANVWIELGGQLVFDPLNALGKVSKTKQAAEFSKLAKADMTVVEAGGVLEKMVEATQAGDKVKSLEMWGDAFKAEKQAIDLARDSIEALAKPGGNTKVIDRMKGMVNLIPESRSQIMATRTGLMTEQIFTHLNGNPEEMLDLMRAAHQLQYGNAADSAAAFNKLKDSGVPLNMLFSKAGNDTMVVWGKLVEEHGDGLARVFGKPAKVAEQIAAKSKRVADLTEKGQSMSEALKLKNADNITKLIGDIEKLRETQLPSVGDNAAFLLKTMEKVIDDMYPPAKTLLEAERAVKTGKEVTDRVKRLAEIAGKMSPGERKIAELHTLVQDKAVGPINKLFAKVYLGMSPGYAFRNLVQNEFQMWIDYGAKVAFGGADNAYQAASKLNGGFIDAGEAFGKEEYGRVLGQFDKTDFWSITKQWWSGTEGKGRLDARIAAGGFEAQASRKIVGFKYTETFKNAMKPLFTDLAKDVRFKNLTPEHWRVLEGEIVSNFGDVDKAILGLKKSVARGFDVPFSRLESIPKGIKDYITRNEVDQEVIDTVLNAKTREEAIANANRVFDALGEQGKAAYSMGRQPNLENQIERVIATGVMDGHVSTATQLTKGAQIQAVDEAVDSASKLLMTLRDVGAKTGNNIDSILVDEFGQNILKGWTDSRPVVRQNTQAAADIIHAFQKDSRNLAGDWDELVKLLDIQDPTTPATRDEFIRRAWDAQNEYTTKTYGKDLVGQLDKVQSVIERSGLTQYMEDLDFIRAEFDKMQNLVVHRNNVLVSEIPLTGTRSSQISQLANKYKIPSATEGGAPLDKMLLNIINKYAGRAGDNKFLSLSDPISLEMAEEAFAKYVGADVAKADDAARVVGDVPENVRLAPESPNARPNPTRDILMNNEDMRGTTLQYIEKNFGVAQPITRDIFDDDTIKTLSTTLKNRVTEIRTVSANVARSHRDFTLLNYGSRTYADVALSYLFPYSKWYTGTYANWSKRIATNPALISHYQLLKDKLALQHSELPDWWKYNISTADLPTGVQEFLGIEDNPLFLNLEATLWPLQGLTGVDFQDPEKVVNWWTFALDQLGKYGPSVWTPFTMATGMYLKAKGDSDAGDRWLGRFSSQTATIKSVTSAAAGVLGKTEAGKAIGIKEDYAGLEIDPFVALLEGGQDPYEERRVRRYLGEILLNNPNDPELQAQAIDAAYSHSGPLWEQASAMASRARLQGNVGSTLFGVGFKARSQEDMQVDMFYTEYSKLMSARPNMSPDGFRNQMALMGQKYPFMDTVLIGSKSTEARDAAFSYNVLSRIPPGDMSPLLEFVGVRQDSIDYFYNNKGDLSGMSTDDRMRFNAGMLSLAAVLQMPSTATKQEWNTAKFQYDEAQVRAGLMERTSKGLVETQLGQNLQTYYALLDEDRSKANDFLSANPALQQAMGLRDAFIANNPTLNAYYGGINTIEKYFQSQARTIMVNKYGQDIYLKYDYYNSILDGKAKSTYLKEHPELKAFKEEKNQWQDWVNKKTGELAGKMPEGTPPGFRQAATETQQSLQGMILQGQRQVTSQELTQQMSPELQQAVSAWLSTGGELPYTVRSQLDYLARQYGLYANDVIQILIQGTQPVP